MRRAAILLTLLVAVVLMMSAPMAEAAKKRQSRSSSYNTVQCPNRANGICVGTSGADLLKDQAGAYTDILGRDGNDVYVEYSGGSDHADTLEDHSYTSSDYYYIANNRFNTIRNDALWMIDYGGSNDILDLSGAGYSTNDCDPYPTDARGDGSRNDLYIDCPGRDDIIVFDYYTTNSIEKFKFTNGTFDGPKGNYFSSNATTQGQTPEGLPDKKQSDKVLNQAEKNASSADDWGQQAEQTGGTTREGTSSGG